MKFYSLASLNSDIFQVNGVYFLHKIVYSNCLEDEEREKERQTKEGEESSAISKNNSWSQAWLKMGAIWLSCVGEQWACR